MLRTMRPVPLPEHTVMKCLTSEAAAPWPSACPSNRVSCQPRASQTQRGQGQHTGGRKKQTELQGADPGSVGIPRALTLPLTLACSSAGQRDLFYLLDPALRRGAGRGGHGRHFGEGRRKTKPLPTACRHQAVPRHSDLGHAAAAATSHAALS